MSITRETHYSRVERVVYTVRQSDTERALMREIASRFNVDVDIGQWEFDWYRADEPEGELVVRLIQRFEHESDGVPATLEGEE